MRGTSLVSLHGRYRVCPDCGARCTADPKTKTRGLVLALWALSTLASAAAGFLAGFPWGFLTLFLGTGSLLYAGYAVSKMYYVRYVN